MELFLIISIAITIVTSIIIFNSVRNNEQADEAPQEPKFQPRRITIVNNEVVEKPKRRYKRRTKKKKPVVTEDVAPVEKKPVGRPKKSK